jgi:hypothetical protein
MSAIGFTPDLLLPMGRVLLFGATGYSIYQVVRSEYEFEEAIVAVMVGLIGLTFYQSAFSIIDQLSQSLLDLFSSRMNRDSLKEQIIIAIKSSSETKNGKLPDAGAFFDQVWRSGVWGVVSSFTELLFVLADLLIESAQQVFMQILVLLTPLACGLFPLFPKLLTNFAIYAFELSLWRPVIVVVHEVTSMVARQYLANDTSHGLRIVAVEIVAVVLILSIPTVTHKLLSGAMAGDFGAGSGFAKVSKRVYGSVTNVLGGALK